MRHAYQVFVNYPSSLSVFTQKDIFQNDNIVILKYAFLFFTNLPIWQSAVYLLLFLQIYRTEDNADNTWHCCFHKV